MWEEQRPWNVYHYSANNPIVLKDPNGEAPVGATPTDHTPRYEDPMRNGAGGDPKSGSSGGGKVRSAVQGVIKNGASVGESTIQQEEARNRREAQSQVQIAEGKNVRVKETSREARRKAIQEFEKNNKQHKNNARGSTKGTHEKGQAAKRMVYNDKKRSKDGWQQNPNKKK